MTKRLLLGLAGIFVVCHVAVYCAGVRFETYPLQWFLHFLDPKLLRTRLLQSVFYLHIQPPLFNLFAGAVLKLTPKGGWLFQLIFLTVGFFFYVALVGLQIRLGVSRPLAVLTGTAFLVSPSFFLYEHWLFYTFPCAALVTISAVVAHQAAQRPSWRPLTLLFFLIMTLCGMCSLFHLVYFVCVVALMVFVLRGRRKLVLVTAFLPFALLLSVYVKNWWLFDSFTASTLMGKNLWIMTVGNMNGQLRSRLVKEGKLSKVSMINRFDTLDRYPAKYRQVAGYENVPALRQFNKSNGAHNFNNLAQVAISRQYLHDALYGLTRYPWVFVRSSMRSWRRYFTASAIYSPVNTKALTWLSAVYDSVVYGELSMHPGPDGRPGPPGNRPVYLFLLVGLPLLAFYGLRCAITGTAGSATLTPATRATLAFAVMTIGYVAVIGNAFDIAETNRYRFMTDPLSVVCLGMALQYTALPRLRGAFRRRRERRHATSSPT